MNTQAIGPARLEAFSDGVIAIIVTIMVLELHTPAEPTMAGLLKIAPSLLSYALSFLLVAIMWVNHHHMTHALRKVTGRVLWYNINLLFWMSLTPFTTAFVGRNFREPFPVAVYGAVLALCSLAFKLLRGELIDQYRDDHEMHAYHSLVRRKNSYSLFLYLLSIPLAYYSVYASYLIFAGIAGTYFLPERKLAEAPLH
jgi:uncharacterized membrane protein